MVQYIRLMTNGRYEMGDFTSQKGKKRYEQLQDMVGGRFQYYPTTPRAQSHGLGYMVAVNEEGLMIDLPTNPWGVYLRYMGCFMENGYWIVAGDIVIVPANENTRAHLPSDVVSFITRIKDLDDAMGKASEEEDASIDVDSEEAALTRVEKLEMEQQRIANYFAKHFKMPPAGKKRAGSDAVTSAPPPKKARK